MNQFLVKEYIRYFHLKSDEHSLHSPFFYKFYQNLIKNKGYSSDWKLIEEKRQMLLSREEEIEIFDLGAGSKVEKSSTRKIKSIAKHSLSSSKFSQFLYRLIEHHEFTNIIELGTSLGINTAYLSKANPKATINTFEADQNAIRIAKEVNKTALNITFNEGDIAETLPQALNKSSENIDLVYADANHTYAASIAYFNILLPHLSYQSIFVMDDIHWSAPMKKAWQELQQRAEVTSSIDLFDAGLLFFNKDFKKQHHILSF